MITTSQANQRVRYARSLQRERVRTRQKRFLVEGTRLVEEALRAGARPVLAFYTDRLRGSERGRALVSALVASSPSLMEVTPEVMASMAETVTPQGVLVVVPFPELPWPEHGLILILDGLRDPGNVGTIMRTAWAAGMAGLVTTHGTADPYAPKVVRSAMGAHFHLPLQAGLDRAALAGLLGSQPVLLADRHGLPYWQFDWRGDQALIIGGEACGSELAAGLAHRRVAVPMAEGVESLNAAVAAGVLLFEARRQREGPT